jgi:hypothetical protein
MVGSSSRMLAGALAAIGLAMTIGCETLDSGSPAGTPPPRAAAAKATVAAPAVTATPTSGPRPAAGAAGDSLEACLARIPQDATASQRMLAERTCQRDEENRQPISRVPGR